MKNLLLFILLFTATCSFGQFLGHGSEWTYTCYPTTGPDSIKLKSIEVIGDTLVDNKTVYEIEGRCGCGFYARHLYQEGSKTYYYYQDQFYQLYDFSLGVGDTLKVHTAFAQEWMFPGVDTLYFPIKAVDEINKGGQVLKVQHLEEGFPAVDSLGNFVDFPDWGGSLVENVGGLHCIFPTTGLCDDGCELRCFQFATGEVFNFTVGESCLLNPITTPQEIDLTIFPNPFLHFFQIENLALESYDLRIFNIQGQLLLESQEIQTAKKEINTDNWPSGMYILELKKGKGQAYQKIIKR